MRNSTTILILILLLSLGAKAQTVITDTAALRLAINTDIIANNARQITADKLNRIFNGQLNCLQRYKPDTIYISGGHLYYKIFGVTRDVGAISTSAGWNLTGNSGTVPGTNFIGTTDAQSLFFKVNNLKSGVIDFTNANAGFGILSLNSVTSGQFNSAFGKEALNVVTTASSNSAFGYRSLYNNTGTSNTAFGYYSQINNSTGTYNTSIGLNSLQTNTTGTYNSALGINADVISTNLTNATAIGANAQVGQSNSISFGDSAADSGNGTNVGIGTSYPHYSSSLELKSTTKGFLINRMNTVQRDAIPAPATGLMIYNTTTDKFNYNNGGWVEINSGEPPTWQQTLDAPDGAILTHANRIINNDYLKIIGGAIQDSVYEHRIVTNGGYPDSYVSQDMFEEYNVIAGEYGPQFSQFTVNKQMVQFVADSINFRTQKSKFFQTPIGLHTPYYTSIGFDSGTTDYQVRFPAKSGKVAFLDDVTATGAAGGDLSGAYPNPSVVWANGYATYDARYPLKNTAITGATKTKITYDSKGLVTDGADAITSDIAEGSNLYFTNARAIGSTLTGYTSGAGVVESSDNILQAIQKLNGNDPKFTFISSDVVNNNAVANTIADVTGLSFPVTSGVTYKFKFFIVYDAAATTTGSRFTINGPAATFVNFSSSTTTTASGVAFTVGISAYDTPAASSGNSLTTGNIAVVEGIIRTSASGTVIARFASEVSSSAITVKGNRSYVEYQVIN